MDFKGYRISKFNIFLPKYYNRDIIIPVTVAEHFYIGIKFDRKGQNKFTFIASKT